MSFTEWMREVGRWIVVSTDGDYSIRDLPEQPWRQWYDDGMDPEEAAELAMERAGMYHHWW